MKKFKLPLLGVIITLLLGSSLLLNSVTSTNSPQTPSTLYKPIVTQDETKAPVDDPSVEVDTCTKEKEPLTSVVSDSLLTEEIKQALDVNLKGKVFSGITLLTAHQLSDTQDTVVAWCSAEPLTGSTESIVYYPVVLKKTLKAWGLAEVTNSFSIDKLQYPKEVDLLPEEDVIALNERLYYFVRKHYSIDKETLIEPTKLQIVDQVTRSNDQGYSDAILLVSYIIPEGNKFAYLHANFGATLSWTIEGYADFPIRL